MFSVYYTPSASILKIKVMLKFESSCVFWKSCILIWTKTPGGIFGTLVGPDFPLGFSMEGPGSRVPEMPPETSKALVPLGTFTWAEQSMYSYRIKLPPGKERYHPHKYLCLN